MPLFLDRHDLPGVAPEALAEAHTLDLAVEDKYGVHYHTYWFDPSNGSVFCLAEGPDEETIAAVHQEAHGQVASAIIRIDASAPLNELLGAFPTYPAGTPYTAPAMRAIVFTDVCGSVAQTHELGDEGHMALLREHNELVRQELVAHVGTEVKHTGDGIMAAFVSAAGAVAFGVAVQRALALRNASTRPELHLSIGISAGEPVSDENEDLFGAAVQLAARLCAAAGAGDVAVSLAVRELCVGKAFRFDDRGEVALKGLPDPVPMFAVAWRG